MKYIFFLIAGMLLIFSCSGEKTKIVKKYSIEQFYKNINIFGRSFSPDESKLLVTSNQSGIYNVYALPLNGDSMQTLTRSGKESFFAVSYLPESERFLYSADQGGNENSHIYLVDEKMNSTDLTPWEKAKSNFYRWQRDGQSFLFLSNKRNPKFFDLYEKAVKDIENPAKFSMLYQNDEGLELSAVSKDKRYLALVKSITTNNNELYLYDTKTKTKKHISAHKGDASYSPQFFDLAGKYLYLLTNEDSEFMYLARYNLENGKRERVWETNWDLWYAYNSYNEKYRVIGINEDARTIVKVFDLKNDKIVNLPDIQGGSVTSVSISKSEKLAILSVSTSSSPRNLYLYNFKTGALKKLTNTLNPEINQEDLVEGKVVRFASFDGMEIPAVYYKPHSASPSHKVPALVWVHGGPGGQSRLGYFSLIQFLVNHDYAILAVNNRGSSGYGKTFNKADDRRHGEDDLKDCIAGKKYLRSLDYITKDKIGIIGGSYGGYMVMAALAFAPDEFDAGVNIFGVTNWLRTLKSIPPYWESFRKALYAELGDPFTRDSVRLRKISPLFHAENVKRPLMVLQGANDPRVLQVESDEIVSAVRKNGVPVEYVLFDDEGHGFRKKANEIKGYGKVKLFLDTYLKKTEPVN